MAGFCICLVKVSQGFEYVSSPKYARTGNMARVAHICRGCTGCWICLNKLVYASIKPQYVWICLKNAEYALICLHIPALRVLNMPESWMCLIMYIAQPSKFASALSNCWDFCWGKSVFSLICFSKSLTKQNCLNKINVN